MSLEEEYGFTQEDVQAYVLEKVASGEMDVRDTFKFKKMIEEAAKIGYSNREGWTPKQRADKEIGSLAYKYLLDNKSSATEAIEYSLEKKGYDWKWWEEVKSHTAYQKHSKAIVEEHKEHPLQQQMESNNVFVTPYMTSIDRIGTLMNKLEKAKNANERITTLEQIAKAQQQELEMVRAQSIANSLTLKSMEELNQLKKLEPKDLARELWKRKVKQKDAAEHVGVNVRTIRRWWTEFKNE